MGVDLDLKAQGDIEVGFHHTVEDIGICLGMPSSNAGEILRGLNDMEVPSCPWMRPWSWWSLIFPDVPIFLRMETPKVRVEGFDTALIKEFFQALVNRAGLTLHSEGFGRRKYSSYH